MRAHTTDPLLFCFPGVEDVTPQVFEIGNWVCSSKLLNAPHRRVLSPLVHDLFAYSSVCAGCELSLERAVGYLTTGVVLGKQGRVVLSVERCALERGGGLGDWEKSVVQLLSNQDSSEVGSLVENPFISNGNFNLVC